MSAKSDSYYSEEGDIAYFLRDEGCNSDLDATSEEVELSDRIREPEGHRQAADSASKSEASPRLGAKPQDKARPVSPVSSEDEGHVNLSESEPHPVWPKIAEGPDSFVLSFHFSLFRSARSGKMCV